MQYRDSRILVRLEPNSNDLNDKSTIIAQAYSNPFTVYSAKKFPGMTGIWVRLSLFGVPSFVICRIYRAIKSFCETRTQDSYPE
ncbi:hypothetical protein BC937DRAFT_91401 [Endogone sp. FLAS-F59071]|nr:hypothetical protein BC937DRAFT_91401 [Endogone sp. FLAS-F59071]|eukprot:RUS21809.1 hypothetical protein BC937DRAFT_91401 [Endogone sp. FLAS-F59071]